MGKADLGLPVATLVPLIYGGLRTSHREPSGGIIARGDLVVNRGDGAAGDVLVCRAVGGGSSRHVAEGTEHSRRGPVGDGGHRRGPVGDGSSRDGAVGDGNGCGGVRSRRTAGGAKGSNWSEVSCRDCSVHYGLLLQLLGNARIKSRMPVERRGKR
jgi:hypothetical protein